MPPAGPRSVLIVEEQAHWDNGHFPVRCAQLATAYAELGFHVELLTSEGWSRHGEQPQPRFTVRRYRSWARRFRRFLSHQRERRGAVAYELRSVLLIHEIRARARAMVPEPEAIIVLGWETDPAVVAVMAGPGRLLVNQFRDPAALPQVRPLFSRYVDGLGRRAEARRRANAGCLRVAVAFEARRDDWQRTVPYLDPVVAPIAGVRDLARIPDARAQLGLPTDAKVALLFGDAHAKQRDVVLEAFARLDDWTLVVGGRVADGLDPTDVRFRFPGSAPDAVRDLLFSAADLVVLSFVPDYRENSGTLMDAISFGVPVVCSDDAAVAAVVTQFRLGTPFTNGDAEALADAVRQIPTRIAPDDLAAARQEHSNRAVARRQLLLLGLLPPPT